MPSYKIIQKCFYAESGARPQLYYPGDIYKSETLKPEKAPKYFKLIGTLALVPASAPTPAANEGGEGVPAAVEMSYQEMKTFILDNNIKVADQKKETLVAAIATFKKDAAAPAAEGEENSSEEGSSSEGGEGVPAELPND